MILGPGALVLRGGTTRDPAKLLAGLQYAVLRDVDARLCVIAGLPQPGETSEDLFLRLCKDGKMPWGQVMASTEGRLDQAGFQLLDCRTGLEAYCHYEYDFGHLLSEEDLKRWVDCFDLPVRNPAKETP